MNKTQDPLAPVMAQVPVGIPLTGSDHAADAQTLMALGAMVQASAGAENQLRNLYCALVASKFAAVTAAGQSAEWLMESCKALAKVDASISLRDHADLSGLSGLSGLIGTGKGLFSKRNAWVHGMWAVPSADKSYEVARSGRNNHKFVVSPTSVEDLVEAVGGFIQFAAQLQVWGATVLAPTSAAHGHQLAWEEYLSGLSPEGRAELIGGRLRAAFPDGTD